MKQGKLIFKNVSKRGKLIFSLEKLGDKKNIKIKVSSLENNAIKMQLPKKTSVNDVIYVVRYFFSKDNDMHKLQTLEVKHGKKKMKFSKLTLLNDLRKYFSDKHIEKTEFEIPDPPSGKVSLFLSYDIEFLKYSSGAFVFSVINFFTNDYFVIKVKCLKNSTMYISIASAIENYEMEIEDILSFIQNCFIKNGNPFFGIERIVLSDLDFCIVISNANVLNIHQIYNTCKELYHSKQRKLQNQIIKKSAEEQKRENVRTRIVLDKVKSKINHISIKMETEAILNTYMQIEPKKYSLMLDVARYLEYILLCNQNFKLTRGIIYSILFKINSLPEYQINAQELPGILKMLHKVWNFSLN